MHSLNAIRNRGAAALYIARNAKWAVALKANRLPGDRPLKN